MNKCIQSILDTDLYKVTMSNAYFLRYPNAEGTFTFHDRGGEKYDNRFLEMVKEEIDKMCRLFLTVEESGYLESLNLLDHSYIAWLSTFRFEKDKIAISLDSEGKLHIDVTDKMYAVTLYEVPILAIVSECRNKWLDVEIDIDNVIEIYLAKQKYANENHLPFSEFGTRRRASFMVQNAIVNEIAKTSNTCVGTSNLFLAKKFKLMPCGTMAHELFMFNSGIGSFKSANRDTIDMWLDVYGGKLGTALIDTFTTKSFLKTLTKSQAEKLQAFRQDSGDEKKIGDMIIARLQELDIDPLTKTIVFSNALTFEKYKEIYDYFKGRINVSSGIGTFITCDLGIDGYKPANIIMKLSKCRLDPSFAWNYVIKMSDDGGKFFGSKELLEKAHKELGITKLENCPCYDISRNVIGYLSRSCAAAVFIFARDRNGVIKTLASERGKDAADFNGFYNAPCGYLDYGETLKECAAREVKEECGIEIPTKDLELIEVNDSPNANRQNVTFHYKCLITDKACEDIVFSKDLNEGAEVGIIRWVTREEAKRLLWAFGHGKVIDTLFERLESK